MKPHYAHAQQRSSRLSPGDDIFKLVDRVPTPPRPEPIPVGEARELRLPVLVEQLIGRPA